MHFSLICATFGRSQQVAELLESLAAQTCRDFDLTVVDQNADDRVEATLPGFAERMRICRMSSSPPGLARALNLALRQAAGEVIAFPDDDCTYGPDLLRELAALFAAHPEWDGITARTLDASGKASIARWDRRPGRIEKSNVGFRGCSTSVFYRRKVVERVGLFDETIGAESGANPGFDMDYLHRVVRAGFRLEYQPQLVVRHPQSITLDGRGSRKRYTYGFGEGMIARKYSLPVWYTASIVVFPLGRAITKIASGRRTEAAQEWLTFRGRLAGWMATKPIGPVWNSK